MQVQIDHTYLMNKGAELMFRSIIERLKSESRLDLKFMTGVGVESNTLIKQILMIYSRWYKRTKLSRSYAVAYPDVVLDAGGFRLSDQWIIGAKHPNFVLDKIYQWFKSCKIYYEEKYYLNLKRNNAKIIFLPQAFGPFKNPVARKKALKVLSNADLIYARDKISYNHLIEFLGKGERIKIAPDFTCLLKPNITEVDKTVIDVVKNSIILIPNAKMITHTDKDLAQRYDLFLTCIVDEVSKLDRKLVLLNHEGEGDMEIIKRLEKKFSNILVNKLFVLNNLTVTEVKAVISQAYCVVSSRFHGVVSALSQGVPTLCTSWSHKYQELLNDYDYDGMLNVDDLPMVKEKLGRLLLPEYNKEQRIKLELKSKMQQELAEKMWQEVISWLYAHQGNAKSA